MPKQLLTVGSNVLNPSVYFNNQKTAVVNYGKTFTKVPQVMLSLEDEATAPPRKFNPGVSSATIKFQTNYSGWVSVQVTERE
jgi:hypothetical protein